MKKIAILALLAFSLTSHSQQVEGSTEQIYKELRSAEFFFSLEQKAAIANGNDPIFLSSKNLETRLRLQKVIETRADAGDSAASFYTGVLKSVFGAKLNSEKRTNAGIDEYETATIYYKRACLAGVFNGCWNVATIYLNGDGLTRSGLAAAEWFYRAGVGYLANGERERALAALESMQKIDSKHPLAVRLALQLEKGTPK